MKAVVNSYDFAEAVNKVAKACAENIEPKVLAGIKLTAQNDELLLTAFDTEMCIKSKIKGETIIDGEMAINGRLLSEYANKIKGNEQVEIELQANGQAKIQCGKLKFTLSTLNVKDFPLISVDTCINTFDIPVVDLKRLISQTAFCSATDNARPILKGVSLETIEDGKTLIACALDGFRLAKAQKEVITLDGNVRCIVPARSLIELVKLIGSDVETITVNISNHYIVIKTENTVFLSRLLAGQFVNYQTLLASPFNTTAKVDTKELVSALDRASILAKTESNIIHLSLKSNKLTISTKTEIGDTHEELETKQNGSDIELHLNYKYLLDCLKAVDSEKVLLQMRDSQSPMFIRKDEEDKSWEYLILPIRVNRG